MRSILGEGVWSNIWFRIFNPPRLPFLRLPSATHSPSLTRTRSQDSYTVSLTMTFHKAPTFPFYLSMALNWVILLFIFINPKHFFLCVPTLTPTLYPIFNKHYVITWMSFDAFENFFFWMKPRTLRMGFWDRYPAFLSWQWFLGGKIYNTLYVTMLWFYSILTQFWFFISEG